MSEVAIALFGDPPHFDPKAGPLTGLVEVEGGTAMYLLDPERGRVRLAAIPGPEFDKWTSPAGLLLLARSGWWGCSARLDGYPNPSASRGRPATAPPDRLRPFLPRDLASCPGCRALVVLRRDREGPGFLASTPTARLARRAAGVFRSHAIPSGPKCAGKGRRAGRAHSLDCYLMPTFRPFSAPKDEARRRGRSITEPRRGRAAPLGGGGVP